MSYIAVRFDAIIKNVQRKLKLLMEAERTGQNKSILEEHFVFITICSGMIGFQNFCFSSVFMLCQPAYKINRKTQMF